MLRSNELRWWSYVVTKRKAEKSIPSAPYRFVKCDLASFKSQLQRWCWWQLHYVTSYFLFPVDLNCTKISVQMSVITTNTRRLLWLKSSFFIYSYRTTVVNIFVSRSVLCYSTWMWRQWIDRWRLKSILVHSHEEGRMERREVKQFLLPIHWSSPVTLL